MPLGCVIAVVGAVGSDGFPDAREGGGAGTVCVVAGTVCCAIAPPMNTVQNDNIASGIIISEVPFISYLFLGKNPLRSMMRSRSVWLLHRINHSSVDAVLAFPTSVSENRLAGESQFDQHREERFMSLNRITHTRSALTRIALLAFATSLSAFVPAQTSPAPTVKPTTAPAAVPPIKGIAHIAIRVKDIAASLAFYHKLGFDQAFANTGKDGVVSQSFIKLNDRQFIELYPLTDRDTQVGFLHLCFEGADLIAIHDYYVAESLTPISVRTAGAGNLLFTMKGLQQFAEPQNIEYTQYMPGSKHSNDFGQHLSPDRVGDKMTVVALAMQDPAAARTFYLNKLGFTPDPANPARLSLPGTTSEQVEIVPIDPLGRRSSIILESTNLDKAAAQLTRQQVEFQRASATNTDADGKSHTIDMISVNDPDGNIIRLQSAH